MPAYVSQWAKRLIATRGVDWHTECMTYTPPFPNASDDMIDSRDILWHISDLSSDLENAEADDERDNIRLLLVPLLALAEEGETLEDWEYGVQLIHDGYFTDFAQQFAEEIRAIDSEARWPAYCID